MTFVADDVDPSGLERKSPTEAADIDEITRGMLAIQAQAAAKANSLICASSLTCRTSSSCSRFGPA